MFNSTKSRSSHPKTCKTRKSLFLTQFIKKIPKQSFKGVMQKFTKLTKKTSDIKSFFNIFLKCAPIYKKVQPRVLSSCCYYQYHPNTENYFLRFNSLFRDFTGGTQQYSIMALSRQFQACFFFFFNEKISRAQTHVTLSSLCAREKLLPLLFNVS